MLRGLSLQKSQGNLEGVLAIPVLNPLLEIC